MTQRLWVNRGNCFLSLETLFTLRTLWPVNRGPTNEVIRSISLKTIVSLPQLPDSKFYTTQDEILCWTSIIFILWSESPFSLIWKIITYISFLHVLDFFGSYIVFLLSDSVVWYFFIVFRKYMHFFSCWSFFFGLGDNLYWDLGLDVNFSGKGSSRKLYFQATQQIKDFSKFDHKRREIQTFCSLHNPFKMWFSLS